MDKVDSLFFLIKSLSKAQKRYFKINTPHIINGQNNYMKLFDALESQRDYDEEQIVKDFAGETFIKHLPSEKNYLYELILKTMRAYQAEKNVKTKLIGMVQDIRFLKDNKMEAQAYKKLRKAKKLAESNEEFRMLLDLFDLEKSIIYNLDTIETEETFEQVLESEQTVRSIMHCESAILDLWYKAKILSEKPFEEVKNEWQQVIKELEVADEQNVQTFNCRLNRCEIRAFVQTARGELSEASKSYEKAVSVWNEFEDRKQEDANDYKALLKSWADVRLKSGDYDGFEEILQEIKSIQAANIRTEISDLKDYLFYEFQSFVEQGLFKKAEAVIPHLTDRLDYFRYLIDNGDLVYYYFNIAVYYFIIGQPKKVTKWISRIKRLKTEAQMDIQVFSCFIEIMAHFEQRKETHMQYILRNNFQFIQDRPKLNHFQSTINKNIRKILKLKTRDQIIDLLFKLRSEMMLYKEAKIEAKLIGIDEMILWIDSQIKDVPIKQVYLQNIESGELV